MNLTQIILETGRRIRRGKLRREKLTNEQVKLVLENAVEVIQDALIHEGRVEIQDFAVMEVTAIPIKPTNLYPLTQSGRRRIIRTPAQRILFMLKPSGALRRKVKDKIRKS